MRNSHHFGALGETYKNGSGKYSISVYVAAWKAGDYITYRIEVYCE